MKYIAKPREVEVYLHRATGELYPDDAPLWIRGACPSFLVANVYYVKEEEGDSLPIVTMLSREQFHRQFETPEDAATRRMLDVNLALLGGD